jgi:hypothetical protein
MSTGTIADDLTWVTFSEDVPDACGIIDPVCPNEATHLIRWTCCPFTDTFCLRHAEEAATDTDVYDCLACGSANSRVKSVTPIRW